MLLYSRTTLTAEQRGAGGATSSRVLCVIAKQSEKILASDLYLIDFIGESDKDKAQAEISRSKLIPLPRYRAHPKYHRDAFFPKDAIVLAKWPTSTVFYKAFVVDIRGLRRGPRHKSRIFRISSSHIFRQKQSLSARPVPIDSSHREESIDISHGQIRVPTGNLPFYVTHVTHSTPSDQEETYHVNFDFELEEEFVDEFTSPEVPQMFVINYVEMAKDDKPNSAVPNTAANEHSEPQSAVGGEAETTSNAKNVDLELEEKIGDVSELCFTTAKSRTENHHDNDFCYVNQESAAGGGAKKTSASKNDASVLQIGGKSELPIVTAKSRTETHHDNDFSDVNDEDGRDAALVNILVILEYVL
ncbi:SGF29 tudor-like domain-containing protein [Ditylenchus destructor]|uniref:SGF29 tudor-like domain-containing protein n=1 Tax=Ditylenchus destructor TaxID=166010 RepID=A0AAD4MKW8_9BILA|nr:SGF29 tudor-like domain-containing protein [Ditylenchus destructor]